MLNFWRGTYPQRPLCRNRPVFASATLATNSWRVLPCFLGVDGCRIEILRWISENLNVKSVDVIEVDDNQEIHKFEDLKVHYT